MKVLPALEVLAAHPRPTDDTWYNPVSVLIKALLSHDQSHNQAFVNGWGFWEFGAYVGLFAVIALPSCMVPRKSLVWILAGVVFFLLGWGAFSPHAPWVWLHKLPGFSSTRLPGRFLIPFTLVVAVLAGFGLDIVCGDGSTARVALAASLVMIGGIDMLVVGSPNLNYVLEAVTNPGPPRTDFVQYHRDPVSVQSSVISRHEGVTNCYVSPNWQTGVIGWNQPGYRGEQYLDGPGSVQLLSWSPNVLQFEVDTPAPSILVVNQNYDRGWRVVSGAKQTRSLDGLLSVPVSAGKNLIVLRYLSLSALLGLVTTLVITLGAVVLAWIERRPGVEASGAAS